jgi:amino acid transporter
MIAGSIFIGFTVLVIAGALINLRKQIKKQNEQRNIQTTMKKTLPYILIIAASYLVVAFVVNDINPSQWHWSDRLIVIMFSAFFSGVYLLVEQLKK